MLLSWSFVRNFPRRTHARLGGLTDREPIEKAIEQLTLVCGGYRGAEHPTLVQHFVFVQRQPLMEVYPPLILQIIENYDKSAD